MYKNVFVFVLFTSWSYGQESCTRPDGLGVCKHYSKCPGFIALANQKDIPIHNIQSYVCDNERKTACCSDCYTPEGKSGVCAPLNRCPHLKEMSKENSTLNFVINSKCTQSKTFCCGPPPSPVTRGVCQQSSFPPDPESECCGFDVSSQDRIVGGFDTKIDEYPWLALLEYDNGTETKLLCGGALISNRYVLTAAHCMKSQGGLAPTKVRLGEFDLQNEGLDCQITSTDDEDCNNGAISVPIEERIIHEGYNKAMHRNDIAILRLSYSVNYTNFIRPICMPTSDVLKSRTFSTLKAYVAGWGKIGENIYHSRYKQHVKVPLVKMPTCQSQYTRRVKPSPALWSRQLCAGGEKGRDSCNGDSGGPLMWETDHSSGKKLFFVSGIVSFGVKRCGTEGMPGVYTNVYAYNTWIRSKIRP